jgi:hypothetical protein
MRAMTMLSDATASSSLDASQWRLASRPVAVPFKQTLVEECYGLYGGKVNIAFVLSECMSSSVHVSNI